MDVAMIAFRFPEEEDDEVADAVAESAEHFLLEQVFDRKGVRSNGNGCESERGGVSSGFAVTIF